MKEYKVTQEQLANLDKIRKLLYLLSLEELPRPLDEQISVAAYQLYYWLMQFEETLSLKDNIRVKNGVKNEWPDTHKGLWDAHK